MEWNIHPETKEPVLQFKDLNVPGVILDRLGLDPEIAIVALQSKSIQRFFI